MAPKELTGRAAVPTLMKRAKEIAKGGSCRGFGHMVEMIGDGGFTLKLWASAEQRDQIDRLCAQARDPLRSSRSRIKRTHQRAIASPSFQRDGGEGARLVQASKFERAR